MAPLILVTGHKLRSRPGSYGAVVDGDELRVPLDVRLAIMLAGWKTVEDFFLGVNACPNVFTAGLGWTEDDCRKAREELRALLRGRLPDWIIDPPDFGGTPGPDGFEE